MVLFSSLTSSCVVVRTYVAENYTRREHRAKTGSKCYLSIAFNHWLRLCKPVTSGQTGLRVAEALFVGQLVAQAPCRSDAAFMVE
jgi:hypothetical protein